MAPNLLIVKNNPSEYSKFAEMDLELLDVFNSDPNFVNSKNNPRFSPKLLICAIQTLEYANGQMYAIYTPKCKLELS